MIDFHKNKAISKYFSELGKKGGKKSKRILTTKEAKEMVKKRWKGAKRKCQK